MIRWIVTPTRFKPKSAYGRWSHVKKRARNAIPFMLNAPSVGAKGFLPHAALHALGFSRHLTHSHAPTPEAVRQVRDVLSLVRLSACGLVVVVPYDRSGMIAHPRLNDSLLRLVGPSADSAVVLVWEATPNEVESAVNDVRFCGFDEVVVADLEPSGGWTTRLPDAGNVFILSPDEAAFHEFAQSAVDVGSRVCYLPKRKLPPRPDPAVGIRVTSLPHLAEYYWGQTDGVTVISTASELLYALADPGPIEVIIGDDFPRLDELAADHPSSREVIVLDPFSIDRNVVYQM